MTTPGEAVGRLAGEHWPRFWPGCDAAAVAADVLGRLRSATVAWGLADVQVMSGGVVALVCSATSHGSNVVVKLSPRVAGGERLRTEGEALAFWRATDAAVTLQDLRDDGYTLLLERLRPGIRLQDGGAPTEEVLRICGDVARRLHAAGRPPRSFERLAVSARTPNWLSVLAGEPELQGELRALLADRGDEVLIHGDLHAANVLRDGEAWKVIDPHAIRADRHAEVQPLLETALSFEVDRAGDRARAERWLRAYTTSAALDPHRTRRFAVLRALGEARHIDTYPNANPEHVRWAAGLHRLATALR